MAAKTPPMNPVEVPLLKPTVDRSASAPLKVAKSTPRRRP